MGNAKYKIFFRIKRKTEILLNGLVYYHLKNSKGIKFGYLVNSYQDGTWTFFHDNGTPSMKNVYKNDIYIKAPQSRDMHDNFINL